MAKLKKETRHMSIEVSSNGFIYVRDKVNNKFLTICPSEIPLLLEACSVSYNRVNDHLGKLALEKHNSNRPAYQVV